MRELENILQLAESVNRKGLFDNCLQSKYDSSWEDANTTKYIERLQLDTPIQLKKHLEEMWKNSEENEIEELERNIVVAAFKLRGSKVAQKETIKERIYNF